MIDNRPSFFSLFSCLVRGVLHLLRRPINQPEIRDKFDGGAGGSSSCSRARSVGSIQYHVALLWASLTIAMQKVKNPSGFVALGAALTLAKMRQK